MHTGVQLPWRLISVTASDAMFVEDLLLCMSFMVVSKCSMILLNIILALSRFYLILTHIYKLYKL